MNAAMNLAGVHQQCRNLAYRRNGRMLLSGIDLALPSGCLTAIVGPNGAGKSTLLRLMGGLDDPSQGEVLLLGQAVRQMSPQARARRIGWLAQFGNTELPLAVAQYVMLGRHARLERFSRPGEEDHRQVMQALVHADLAHKAGQSWNTLSGGERQRAGLARLEAQDVPLWLLDEPTNHLDLKHQFQLLQRLRGECGEAGGGRTIVAVLHDLALASRWADHVVLLCDGRILRQGPPAFVLQPELLGSAYGLAPELFPDFFSQPHASASTSQPHA